MQADADINVLLNLDFRRFDISVALSQTVMRDDPELAEQWRALHRAYMITRFPDRELDMTPYDLLGGSADLLRSHPRYGYVARWLDEWRETSFSLREDICRERGIGSRELDAVLNAELARRWGRGGQEV
jgi:hypothetical protein